MSDTERRARYGQTWRERSSLVWCLGVFLAIVVCSAGCGTSSKNSVSAEGAPESYETTKHNLTVLGEVALSEQLVTSGGDTRAWLDEVSKPSANDAEIMRLSNAAKLEVRRSQEALADAARSMRPGKTREITARQSAIYGEIATLISTASNARANGDRQTLETELRKIDVLQGEYEALNGEKMQLPNVQRFYESELSGQNR